MGTTGTNALAPVLNEARGTTKDTIHRTAYQLQHLCLSSRGQDSTPPVQISQSLYSPEIFTRLLALVSGFVFRGLVKGLPLSYTPLPSATLVGGWTRACVCACVQDDSYTEVPKVSCYESAL